MVLTRIKDIDKGMERTLRQFRDKATFVDIGVQSDEDEKLLIIAAANEYGATINHPGGTPYGYRTAEHAKKGKVSFLKKGSGYMVLGETKPHVITIPPRPFIRSTVDENEEKYFDAAKSLSGQMVDGRIEKYDALERIGQLIEGDIKRTIITLRDPPNAPSTIRKKGSDNPLVNTGHLSGSIRYEIVNRTDTDGTD